MLPKVWKLSVYTLIFATLLLTCTSLLSQRSNSSATTSQQIGLPAIKYYTPDEYDAHFQNYDITQDQDGILYFANYNGVLQYDGSNWRTIPVVNGSSFSVGIGADSTLYVGGVGELGYLISDDVGNLQYQSLQAAIPSKYKNFNYVWQVLPVGPDIFFLTDKYLFRWDTNGSTGDMQTWVFNNIYHTCHVLDEKLYCWEWDTGLMQWEKDSLRLVPNGAAFANSTIRIIKPLDHKSSGEKDLTLVGTVQNGLFTYDGINVQPFHTAPIVQKFLDDNSLHNSIQLGDGSFALATSIGGVAIVNQNGNLIQFLDETTGLHGTTVTNAFVDKDENLWLTLHGGISQVKIPSPFSFFFNELGLDGYVKKVVFYKNKLYALGSSGLFRQSEPAPQDHRTFFQNLKNEASVTAIDHGLVLGEDFLVSTNRGIALVEEGGSLNSFVKSGSNFLLPSRFHKNLIYASIGNEVGILQKNAQGWGLTGQLQGIEEAIYSIAEESSNRLWVTTLENAFRLDLETLPSPIGLSTSITVKKLEKFDQSNRLPKWTSYVYSLEDNIVFSTSAGLKGFDEATQSFVPNFSLPYLDTTRNIFPFSPQPNGDIWFVSSKYEEDELMDANLVQFKRALDGTYQMRSQNINHIVLGGPSLLSIDIDPTNRDLAWISSSNGLIKYNAAARKEHNQSFPALIRKVLINEDSLIFGGGLPLAEVPTMEYASNVMRFEYAAPTFNQPDKTKFQVWLEGFDKNWSNWTNETKKDYTNLPEGQYTFRVRAKNIHGTPSEEGMFRFAILPPWYRSWWAYLVYLILIGGAVYGVVQWRVRQLKQRTLELEALVTDRTRTVVEQAEKLKALDQVKSRFFTNISHEFRTPLTVIGGMAQQIMSAPEKWAQKGSRLIARNNANLLNLVNQILDLRKLETGALNLDLIQGDIVFYLRYILESFHSLAENKDVKLHFLSQEEAVLMDYDKEKILQIVSNLLSNAIKFTPEDGNVYLTVSRLGSAALSPKSTDSHQPLIVEEQLVIQIRDTGIGIPEDKIPYIFDRFYQADDSATRKGEGTGIGLALTRELVKLMEGSIEVESTEEQGSTFKVILPIRREAAREDLNVQPGLTNDPPLASHAITATDLQTSQSGRLAPTPLVPKEASDWLIAKDEQPTTNPQPTDRSTLLIIEDNPDVVEYLESLLADQYQLEIARDGQEGIETALEQIPDLILSDVMMPHKDGFEVCETLKNDERTSHIPIVLLTAKADAESKLAGLKRGADAYLAKPFNPEELFIRLEKLHELRLQLQARYSSLEKLPHTETDTQIEDAFIEKLRTIVESNLNNDKFAIPDLCKVIGMSRSQLHLKLKALTKQNTTHFIRVIRLQKAKILLRQGDLNITQVAFEVGFQSREYFSRAFFKEYNISPKEFQSVDY